MAEEDSQLCLQSVQFMTHNMLATSLPRSNIFSWTSKTSRRESLKAFWIIHGSVVKSLVKQQDGFKGQRDVRNGQLSFSSSFCSCPQHYGWGIAFSQGRAGEQFASLSFKQFFQFSTGTFSCLPGIKKWEKKIWKWCLCLYTETNISELTVCVWVLLILTWLVGKLDNSRHSAAELLHTSASLRVLHSGALLSSISWNSLAYVLYHTVKCLAITES